MNLKKILAATAAGALAVSSMAVSAFAADKTGSVSTDVNADPDAGTWVIASSDIPENCETIKIDVIIPEGGWGGGCVGYNDANDKWTSSNWENGKTTSFEIATSDISDTTDIQCQVWWFGGCDAITFEATFESADEPETKVAPSYAKWSVTSDVNAIKIDLAAFEGIKADIKSIDVELSSTAWAADWGVGGSGALGLNYAGETKQEWAQWDFDADDTNTARDEDSTTAWKNAMNNNTNFVYTFTLADGTKTPYKVIDNDEESKTYGEEISAGIIQLGVWWTAGGNTNVTIEDITINFTDGTSLNVIGNGTEEYTMEGYVEAMNEYFGIEKPVTDDKKDEPKVDEPSTEEPTTPDEPTTEETPKDDAPATGVAVAFAGLALAGTAVVATKKRK